MNSATFNMLLWLGFGIAALIGKAVYERVVTRAEERKAAAEAGKRA
jgi:hypothetical protein